MLAFTTPVHPLTGGDLPAVTAEVMWHAQEIIWRVRTGDVALLQISYDFVVAPGWIVFAGDHNDTFPFVVVPDDYDNPVVQVDLRHRRRIEQGHPSETV